MTLVPSASARLGPPPRRPAKSQERQHKLRLGPQTGCLLMMAFSCGMFSLLARSLITRWTTSASHVSESLSSTNRSCVVNSVSNGFMGHNACSMRAHGTALTAQRNGRRRACTGYTAFNHSLNCLYPLKTEPRFNLPRFFLIDKPFHR